MSKATKVGVFLYNGYQELEFWYPVLRLREAGVEVTVIGLEGAEAASSLLGYPVVPNIALSQTTPGEYAALVLPGGRLSALSDSAPLKHFLAEAAGKGAILAAASQASSLLPDKNGLVARTTDDVPQWTRALLSALQRS
jgi:protease I